MTSRFHTRPLAGWEMIGREQELDILQAALAEAATGQARFIWLAGEAGLGKSKLCRSFAHQARQQQATILYGQAFSRDNVLPFSLFLDLVQRQFAPQTRISNSPDELTSFQQALLVAFPFALHYLPDVALHFPELSAPAFEDGATPASGQTAIFHRIFRGLQALAVSAAGPLVFLLDNLHLADATSLSLLEFLIQRFSACTVQGSALPALLLVGTYRPEALVAAPLLRDMLYDEHISRHTRTLLLQPWTSLEHRQGIQSMLDYPVPGDLSDALFRLDEGNPFFAEELLGALLASGQIQEHPGGWLFPAEPDFTLPVSLNAALLGRFLRLSETDRAVLAMAAVIGRSFHFSLLAAVCDRPESELVLILQRARDEQLIEEVKSTSVAREESYRFRHLLIREAIYAYLLQPACRLKHQAVAEAIEKWLFAGNGQPPAARSLPGNAVRLLAEHYTLAGLAGRASPYALQEAERAHRVSAFREECEYLDMAQAGLPTSDPVRLDILTRLGRLSIGTYDFERALEWFGQARAGYLQAGQTSQALELLAAMSLPAWFLGSARFPAILAELEMAVEQAYADASSAPASLGVLAAATALVGYRFVFCCHSQTLQQTTRNQALYETLTDARREEIATFNTIARLWARANLPGADLPDCLVGLRLVLAETRRRHLYNEAMGAFTNLLALLVFHGQMAEAERVADETLEFEGHYGPLHMCFFIGWKYFYAGRCWDEAQVLLTNNLVHRRKKGFIHLGNMESVVLAHLLLSRHELEPASAYLREAQADLSAAGEYLPLLWLNWGFARLCAAEGVVEEAAIWYARILALWRTTEDRLFIVPILLDGIVFYIANNDVHQTGIWLAALSTLAEQTANPLALAALCEARGALAVLQRRFEFALEQLRAAVVAWEALQFRYCYARAAQHLAELHIQRAQQVQSGRRSRQREREEAEKLLEGAVAIYEELRLAPEQQEIASLRASTHLEAQRKRRQTMRAGEQLTPREMEVLRLLAAGRINKEIAQELDIRQRTVEIHVAHILNKLRCETRVQAALYAVAQGWVRVNEAP